MSKYGTTQLNSKLAHKCLLQVLKHNLRDCCECMNEARELGTLDTQIGIKDHL